jgi:hypothetical protein
LQKNVQIRGDDSRIHRAGGKRYFQRQDHSLNSEDVVAFLEHLLHEVPGRMVLIWDGAPSHRSHVIKKLLANGAAQRNVVDGPVTGLRLAMGVASFFGAMVSLNDFTGYMNAVRVNNGYPPPTYLLANGRGNYWGLSCEPGGFDPAEVSQDDGSPPQVVVEDDHLYGEPAVGTPDELLPPTCR